MYDGVLTESVWSCWGTRFTVNSKKLREQRDQLMKSSRSSALGFTCRLALCPPLLTENQGTHSTVMQLGAESAASVQRPRTPFQLKSFFSTELITQGIVLIRGIISGRFLH